MHRALAAFLKGKREGRTSFSEFFLAFCRTCGVPPMPRYEAECERLLESLDLLSDGTVAIAIPGAHVVKVPPRRDRSEID
jgi:hypothetical protein